MYIRWTEKASADALGIFDYIADQSPAYAESVYERILGRPLQLTVHPRSGSVVPELGRDDVRELFVYSFRLIYRIAEDEIRVLTVIKTDMPRLTYLACCHAEDESLLAGW